MNNLFTLFARLAVAAGFLSAVADRFGLWGKPGDPGVAWGNWQNFLNYTSTLNFGVKGTLLNATGIGATALEVLLGVCLLAGFRVKETALASGVLLLLFGLAMCLNAGIKAPLDYSVFSGTACCLLLYLHPQSTWSMDGKAGKLNAKNRYPVF